MEGEEDATVGSESGVRGTRIPRVIGLIGAVLAILEFIDTYLLKSKIANALRLPAQVPTGLLFVIALLFGALLFALSMRNSKLVSEIVTLGSDADKLRRDLEQVGLDRQQFEKELLSAQTRSTELEQQIHSLEASRQNRSEYVQRLKKQIIALLLTQSRSESDLHNALGISASDQKLRETLRETLGEMVVEKVIRRQTYGFNYELSESRPNP